MEAARQFNNSSELELGVQKVASDPGPTNITSVVLPTESEATNVPATEHNERGGILSNYWQKYRIFGHMAIWLLVTAYVNNALQITIGGGFVG